MKKAINQLIAKGERSAMPASVSPMLCTLVKEPVIDPAYLYEIKWDGYRIVSFVDKSGVRLDSRGGLDYTSKYPPLVRALKALKMPLVLDGEAVVLNAEGRPDFDAMQQYNGNDTPIFYYVFDILWINGFNIMGLTLVERKTILEALLEGNKVIRYSDHFEDGAAVFRQMQELGMEGLVAKKKDSVYKAGERGRNWLKTPTEVRQEFVIGGWAESDRGRPFASVLFGAYNKHGQLEWIGHAGGGFKEAEMATMLKKFRALEIPASPFINKVETDRLAHWMKPVLVANFKFSTWTRGGKIRKPAIFLGFRDDKEAVQVVREIPANMSTEKHPKSPAKKAGGRGSRLATSADSNWRKIEEIAARNRQDFDIEGCTIELHDVDRQVWSDVTKAALIQYYHQVAGFMLPHIEQRPQSLHVKPVNANAPGFYIKDMEGRAPACADIFTDRRKHKKAGKRDVIDYLVCNNEATLLYMVNLGCVDINPWTSRTSNPAEPDYIVIDLDPTDEDFEKVITTGLAAKQYFTRLKLKSFLKTSGKTGLHLLLPCRGFDFAKARSIAEAICSEIHSMVHGITTTEVSIALRGNKLYLDPNQNDYADTIAAPYSARPNKTPTVSIPIEWKELTPKLHPTQFTIHNVPARLEKKGDLWKHLLDEKIALDNSKILQRAFLTG